MFIFLKKKVSWSMKLSGIFVVFFILPIMSFAGINIVEMLPNPIGDDILGEYIEIRNTGCSTVYLGGYRLFDASSKTYIFSSSTMVASHENIRLPYSMTKIALNNSGVESVTFTDSGGVLLDTYSYSGTQRDNIVISISTIDENCQVASPIITDTGIVDSGSSSIGNLDTGSLMENNTGNTYTGIVLQNNSDSTESTNIITPSIPTGSTEGSGAGLSISGSSNTGFTDTGITLDSLVASTGSMNSGNTQIENIEGIGGYDIGSSNTGIVFPEIFPTLQNPTNAIFSGEIFDCSGQSSCRINVIFDPIFTGGVITKDYICEVITDSGSFVTCNPNTLYFSTGGILVFRLTSKIDSGQSISKSWGVIFVNALIENNSGNLDIGSGSGSEDVFTGSANIGTNNSGVSFPEIIPTFQNYTNTVNSGDTLICTMSPCRVNLTLDPIFTGGYLSHDYSCEIQYGTGLYTTCNPPQLYLVATGSIDIKLIHKSSGRQLNKSFYIIQNILSQNTNMKQGIGSNGILDKNPPVVLLEFDGKLKSYHEQIGEYEMNCYTFTCTINLSAENSYDEEGGGLSFLWYYGLNDIKTTRDPGERKYGIGDHQIWLRVIDDSGNITSIRYYIHVLGERKDTKNEVITKKSKIQKTTTKEVSKKIKKSNTSRKITFFDPPNIVLQNSKFIKVENGYICYTSSKNCSLNLTLSGSQKGIIYTWIYEDGEIIVSKNPKSRSLKPGTHTIRIIAGYSLDAPLWNKDIQATVIKTRKNKKTKKVKVSKIVQMSGSKNNIKTSKSQIYDIENEENKDDTIPYTTMALLGGIMPIIILRRLFTGVIWKI